LEYRKVEKRNAYSIPAASTKLRFEIWVEAKFAAPKLISEGGQRILVEYFEASSRHAMNETQSPNLYEGQICRAGAAEAKADNCIRHVDPLRLSAFFVFRKVVYFKVDYVQIIVMSFL
jgi:hypothetical protein